VTRESRSGGRGVTQALPSHPEESPRRLASPDGSPTKVHTNPPWADHDGGWKAYAEEQKRIEEEKAKAGVSELAEKIEKTEEEGTT
jgi:hypothetical protein